MDLSKVKEWKIPEGNVICVQDSSEKIIWMAPIVTIEIKDYVGSGTIDENITAYSFCFSTNPSPFSSPIVNSENLNSYSQRLYVRLGEGGDDHWSDVPAEAHASCYIASGSQMSAICDDILYRIGQGTGYTWDEVRTQILNTTPEVFEELTVYGGNTYEIDLSKYTPTQMMGNPKYIEPNYPLYIICGNGYAPHETAEWDLKTQTVDAAKTVIPVITNATLSGGYNGYMLGYPDVSWISWDTSIDTDATICLVIDENTSTSDRVGSVGLYIEAGMTEIDRVIITQKGKTSSVTKQKPYWNLKSSYFVDYTEQNVTPQIIVTDPDNVGWNIESSHKNLYEIGMIGSVTRNISGEGSESTGYWVAVPENTTKLSRLYTVTLSSNGETISKTTISQDGKSSSGGGIIDPGEIVKPPVSEEEFSLSATTLTLNSSGSAVKALTIYYSGSWTLLYAAEGTSDGTTLKFSQTSGTGDTTVTISPSMPNAGTSVRSWLVTVITSTGLSKTCRVYQQSSSV